jgi:hypothetical protein
LFTRFENFFSPKTQQHKPRNPETPPIQLITSNQEGSDMFEDMYIPWTPRFRRRPETPKADPPTQPPNQRTQPLCNRTLHIARAIIDYASAPFPEIASAISDAFIAFIRGRLVVNTTGQPSDWTAVSTDHPEPQTG